MFRLSRYLFFSTLLASVASVGVFVFVLVTSNALRDIVGLFAGGRMEDRLFWELLKLLVPFAVSFAMPLGFLIGVLLVVGRLSANREILAMRSCGLSIIRISAPIVFLALMGTALAAYINSSYAPGARASYKALLKNVVRDDPLRFIVPQRFVKDFPGYVIYTGDQQDEVLIDFWLWELDENRNAVNLIRAERCVVRYSEDDDSLLLTLYNGVTELRDPDQPNDLDQPLRSLSFSETQLRLSLAAVFGERGRRAELSQMNVDALIRLEKRLEAQIAAATTSEERAELEKERMRVAFNLNRNFAMAFSVLSLTLIGIPLGIRAQRSETYANVALALLLAMSYYLVLIAVGWAEEVPALRPDVLVWVPNIAYQAIGVVLLRRMG